jgi:hypothetical protein
MVLWALCKIEVDIRDSMDVSDEMDHKFEYSNSFFGAFKGICIRKKMYISFMSWLQIQLKMILEENLNEETSTVQESK